ncbi:MAG: AAA family ATPase [Solirubrobacteraceae bacterium]
MRDAEIGDLLRERNRWWRDAHRWESVDPDLREAAEAPFEYRPEALEGIELGGLYTLSGPRRVGKSLELRRTIASLIASGVPARSIVHCSCDGFSLQDLRRLFRVGVSLTRQLDGPRWWLIDEVSAVEHGWSAVMKDLRDGTALRQDCVVLTGSSSRELREARKNLAGRRGPSGERSDRLLLPIPFRDFCGLIGGLDDLPSLPSFEPDLIMGRDARAAMLELSYWGNQLVDAWELYLRVGGFPRAVKDFIESGDVTASFVRDLWDVARGEAIRVTSLNDTQLLSLLARVVHGLCSPLNASRVADDVGLGSHHAVSDRINDLIFAFLLWSCHRATEDGRPNTRAQRKVYPIDPVIARIPSALRESLAPPDVSRLSEQQIGLSLLRAVTADRADGFITADRVMFERTATSEIDFAGGAIRVPFESKYVERGWKAESRALASRHRHGVVATRNILDTDGPIWAVPAAILVWLLGT